jgi:undecaprenyl diphosphate synthase
MQQKEVPKHVAIVLDGNGRWAQRRGLSRSYGHYRGGYNIFTIAKEAKQLGVNTLTIFAFSTENWKRPQAEIDYLMSKPIEIFEDKKEDIDYKIQFIGRRDRVPEGMKQLIEDVEKRSEAFDESFILYVALDYGAHEELLHAIKHHDIKDLNTLKQSLMIPFDIDLLIRTGGEVRLSNFMLLQIAYAELYFTKTPWPAFKPSALRKALKEYRRRNRKFGGL